MRVHYLSHVPFEQLGAMETWFRDRGARISATHLYRGESLPSLASLDVLVIMGGPMGADDETDYPWMAEEKQFIHACIDAGKKVLGICLGAQLIARVLGAPVTPGRGREVGWFPVSATNVGQNDPIGRLFNDAPAVLHWHSDTFGIPEGAIHLLRSQACEHQAFRHGENVLALQFHLELTADNAAALCDACPEDLAPAPFVENRDRLLGNEHRFAQARERLDAVLREFIGV